MSIEIKLEKLSGHAKEGKIGKIHVELGDEVKENDLLVEIESNKGNISIESKVVGKVESIEVQQGDTVKLGDVLFKVEGEEIEKETAENKGGFNYFGSLLKPQKKEIEADITIIGGGPGGYVTAIHAAKLGASVVLVEQNRLGGTCLNWGCIPTKCLVRSAEVYQNLKDSSEYGLNAQDISVDINKVIERKNGIVDQLVDGIEYLMEKNNVKVINGIGKLLDTKTVYVKKGRIETTIKTKNIVIATGSQASTIPIQGVELKNVITSSDALSLKKLPEKLVIVGGGIIGMEFAFIFSTFGVDVTVVEYLDSILAALDQDVCDEITQIAKDKGIKVYTGAKVEEIVASEGKECIVSFVKDGEKKYICTDKVLMSVGRKPYFGDLGLEEIGIEIDSNSKGIRVNEKMETNVENIYAVGDVTNIIQLAHVASHQGIVAVDNIMGKNMDMDYDAVPSAIFTEPEIGMVGIDEKTAYKNNIDIEIGKFPFAANGKALTLGESRGFVKIIKEKATGKVIGGTIIGPHAADLIAEITLAVKNGLTTEQVIETIHAHPTTAESIHEAVLSAEGGALHFAE